MERFRLDQHTSTLRHKKAVACLLWMSANPLEQIEKVVLQFGGGFSAAGPIRGVAARTVDMLTIVAEVGQILHPEIDLDKQAAALMTRLQLGIPAEMAALGGVTGSQLTRGDYLKLLSVKMTSTAAIEATKDADLLAALGGDKEKLQAVRHGIQVAKSAAASMQPVPKLEQLLPAPAAS